VHTRPCQHSHCQPKTPSANLRPPPPLPTAREVDAALAGELSGAAGARSSLHLVVAGHVDAGKSTLMGRLLHDLGLVSQKEAHKNLKEATQAGKVGVCVCVWWWGGG
jgi:hypothetical protein